MPQLSTPSGWFTTGTNTPTGTRKKIAVDNPYLTAAEYIQTPEASGMGIDANSTLYTSGQLQKVILRASAAINRYCERWFDVQTIDETKTNVLVRPYNPQLVTVILQNSPYQVVNSIYLQVLKWFIQIDINSQSGYLQDFWDYGYYKIVPLLSNSGTGVSSPLPAEIVDRTPLGIIWTNYTFGFGRQQTSFSLDGTVDGVNTVFQAPIDNQLWAPDQTTVIYKNGVVVSSGITIDYVQGKVTFVTPPTIGSVITADFTTNETIPEDIRQAVIMLTTDYIFKGSQNPGGFNSLSINAYSVSFNNSAVWDSVKQLIDPYKRNRIKII